jgi:hypothetical protein
MKLQEFQNSKGKPPLWIMSQTNQLDSTLWTTSLINWQKVVGLSNTILEWIHPIEMPKSTPVYQNFHEIEGLQMELYKSSRNI